MNTGRTRDGDGTRPAVSAPLRGNLAHFEMSPERASDGNTDYPGIPARTLLAIRRYADDHRQPGGFVTAVLENNLSRAVATADSENAAALFEIMRYCRWEIPGACWGSPARVAAWLADGETDRAARMIVEAYRERRAEVRS